MKTTIKQKVRKIAVAVLAVIALMALAFYIYTADYYKAEDYALAVMNQGSTIEVRDNLTFLSPGRETDTALVFYPGAKVEEEAYLPLLEQLRQNGITCVLVEMPFYMAIFDSDAAADAIAALPEIERWYIAGHSMGGAMASQFAAENSDAVEGLILLGAYPYGEYPLEDTLTIYGSLNTSVAERVDYTENVVVIEGGNHAQFGNYGPQKGDAVAAITAEEQQEITVAAILNFIEERE